MINFINVYTDNTSAGINNASFEIHQNNIQIITMLDTNTLIELYELLIKRKTPLSGMILIDGKPYDEEDRIEYIHAGFSRVIKEFTVAENVFGLSKERGIYYKKRMEDQCQQLIDKYGFNFNAGTIVNKMTTENQRITEFLRCYIKKPAVLVFNELFNVLSFHNIMIIKSMIADLHLQGTQIIYLTRKFDDVFKLGDEVTVFRDGHYIVTLSRADILKNTHILYDALMGGNSVFTNLQFSSGKDAFDILDVIKIGSEYILAKDSFDSTLERYAFFVEKYFTNSKCLIYYRTIDNEELLKAVYNVAYDEKELPITSRDVLDELLEMDTFFTTLSTDSYVHTQMKGPTYSTHIYAKIGVRGQVNGLLQIALAEPYLITKQDIDFLHITCDEIALIIENTKLIGRSMLLQESHHRIKNNLQLITSMLMLQRNKYMQNKPEMLSVTDIGQLIDTTIYRIQSIAAIHDLLSRAIVLNELITLRAILEEIQKFYSQLINIKINLNKNIPISHTRATSIALIINEMVNNSVKHNQLNTQLKCELSVEIVDGQIIMTYWDNGKGLPKDIKKSNGIGTIIMNTIVQSELEGQILVQNKEGGESGIFIKISFAVQNLY